MSLKTKVLIAGIGGASLGTEIAKCLSLAKRYSIYGCDISTIAFGHYMNDFEKTFVADTNNYVESVISICKKNKIRYIIPGGEKPMVLLAKGAKQMMDADVTVVSNSPEVITTFSDKKKGFEKLSSLGFTIPLTKEISESKDLEKFPFPAIVKPSSGTGGSDSVFLAEDKDQCLAYLELLKRNKRKAIVQEYISLDEGEFTIGVLSLPDQSVVDAVVMKRVFNSKLSISFQNSSGLISSGYSQGLIADFPKFKKQAIEIAKAVSSSGAINIQARVKKGVLIPFEINPRFSASTYLRALAGFNEIDFALQNLVSGKKKFSFRVKEGYYLRSFDEIFVPLKKEKK